MIKKFRTYSWEQLTNVYRKPNFFRDHVFNHGVNEIQKCDLQFSKMSVVKPVRNGTLSKFDHWGTLARDVIETFSERHYFLIKKPFQ